MSVLSGFQKQHANVVMCMLLNGPKINVKRTLWVAKSRFLCLYPGMCWQSKHVLVELILHINEHV